MTFCVVLVPYFHVLHLVILYDFLHKITSEQISKLIVMFYAK